MQTLARFLSVTLFTPASSISDAIFDNSGIIEWCHENSLGHIETSAKDGKYAINHFVAFFMLIITKMWIISSVF